MDRNPAICDRMGDTGRALIVKSDHPPGSGSPTVSHLGKVLPQSDQKVLEGNHIHAGISGVPAPPPHSE